MLNNGLLDLPFISYRVVLHYIESRLDSSRVRSTAHLLADDGLRLIDVNPCLSVFIYK